MKTVVEEICQSCALPLAADPMGGGSEADGSQSREYCSYCYHNGKFKNPDQTLEGMKEMLRPMMAEMDVPPEIVAQTTAALAGLKRWRKV